MEAGSHRQPRAGRQALPGDAARGQAQAEVAQLVEDHRHEAQRQQQRQADLVHGRPRQPQRRQPELQAQRQLLCRGRRQAERRALDSARSVSSPGQFRMPRLGC